MRMVILIMTDNQSGFLVLTWLLMVPSRSKKRPGLSQTVELYPKTLALEYGIRNESFSADDPFNPTTNIIYLIKERSDVKINVYNNLGQVVKDLIFGEKTPGRYEIQLDMSEFSSGLYYYQLLTNNFVQARKLLLMK